MKKYIELVEGKFSTQHYDNALPENFPYTGYSVESDQVLFTGDIPEFIDLGLSVRWATQNAGAKSRYDAGLFCSTCNADAFTMDEARAFWDDFDAFYEYYEQTPGAELLYNSSSSFTVPMSDLHDAAFQRSKGSQKLPTMHQVIELITNCTLVSCVEDEEGNVSEYELIPFVYETGNDNFPYNYWFELPEDVELPETISNAYLKCISQINGNSIIIPTNDDLCFDLVTSTVDINFGLGVLYFDPWACEICWYWPPFPTSVRGIEYIPRNNFFYIESLEDDNTIYEPSDYVQGINKLIYDATYDGSTFSMEISPDGETWSEWLGEPIYLNAGERVYFNCTGCDIENRSMYYIGHSIFAPTAPFKIGGKLETLIHGQDNTPIGEYGASYLFAWSPNLVDASDLILLNSLAPGCYWNLFTQCPQLTGIPRIKHFNEVPEYAYNGMFQDCYNLTTLPENMTLSAKIVHSCAYSYMFYNTNVSTVPDILAETIFSGTCDYMFRECKNITQIGILFPNLTSIQNEPDSQGNTVPCCRSMFYNCTSLVSIDDLFPVLQEANIAEGYSPFVDMFYGCTSLQSLPNTLFSSAAFSNIKFDNTFQLCSSLTEVQEVFPPDSSNNSLYYAFASSGLTKVPKINGTNHNLDAAFSDCKQVSTITEWPNADSFDGTFSGCKALKELPDEPLPRASNLSSMFAGCSSLTKAPQINELAPTAKSLFLGCTNLSEITCLDPHPETVNLSNWTKNVAPQGIFYKNPSATTWTMGVNGIPSGWICKNFGEEDIQFDDTHTNYLTFTAEEAGSTIRMYNVTPWSNIEYSFDRINWNRLDNTSTTITLTNVGDLVYIRGRRINSYSSSAYNRFAMTGRIAAGGSITTLLDYTNDNLELQPYDCYRLFMSCTQLTSSPELPSTVANYCYQSMFEGCTSLTTAPELPAIELAEGCYSYMFSGCTSLTAAPILPASSLCKDCYDYMFKDCGLINEITCYAQNTSADVSSTTSWLAGTASTGTVHKHLYSNWTVDSNDGIPTGWTADDIFTPTVCTSLTITADDVIGNLSSTTIHYTAVTDGIDYNGNLVQNVIFSNDVTSDDFGVNESQTDTIEQTITYEFLGVTATTTITQGVYILLCEVDLNNGQWAVSTYDNPDTTIYDGVYYSSSNYHVHNSSADMFINTIGYTELDVYIRSYGESSYDYVTIYEPNSTTIKSTTKGSSIGGTALSAYKLIHYDTLPITSRIQISYTKDGSGSYYDDRGFVLIKRPTVS